MQEERTGQIRGRFAAIEASIDGVANWDDIVPIETYQTLFAVASEKDVFKIALET